MLTQLNGKYKRPLMVATVLFGFMGMSPCLFAQTSALNVKDSLGNSLLYVRSDGGVGIGTSTPTNFFEVSPPQVFGTNERARGIILTAQRGLFGPGGSMSISAGSGSQGGGPDGGNGGGLSLSAGYGMGWTGGSVQISAGSGRAGGDITLTAGSSVGGMIGSPGGSFVLTAGSAGSAADGGSFTFKAGLGGPPPSFHNGHFAFLNGNVDVQGDISATGVVTVGSVTIRTGTGSPQEVVVGNVGDLFLRADGTPNNTMYVKESGNGTSSGWAAK